MTEERRISSYVPSQFPFVYRENYPQFVEFVKMYYASLEQEGETLYHTRRLLDYRDIDKTPEEYIEYYKAKYLPYLKFVTSVDKRTLVKHVQDLYRSKGTERGIDLFFKLVYGVPAQVYYPSTDLFKLSDNHWVKRNYLEIGHVDLINQFIGKKVIGTRSGATAFAERFVQKKVGGSYVNLLFISSITGNFMYNERITYEGLTISDRKRPKVIGSLGRLDITAGSKDFRVGDVVEIVSDSGYGHGATARVSNVYNTTGVVDFVLEDGGWGYTSNSTIYVSDKILTLQNVVVDYVVNNPDQAPYVASSFFTLEEVYQPLANLDYRFDTSHQTVLVTKPASAWFAIGAVVYQTNTVSNTAVGTIVSNSAVNATSQNLVISVAKANSQLRDFEVSVDSFTSNIVLSTNSLVNSTVLDSNDAVAITTINVGTVLSSYNSTGGVISTVEVVGNDIANLDLGTANLFVYLTSGNSAVNTYFWAPSNTFSINVSAYVNRTATGNVVGFGNTLTMFVSNSTTPFSIGQYLTQRRAYTGGYDISASGKISGIVRAGNSATVTLSESTGVFRRTVDVHMQYANGVDSGNSAYLNSYDGYVGIANINNDFVNTGNNRIYTRGYSYDGSGNIIILGSNTTANLVALSTGKNATFEISNTFAYAETYSVYTDFLRGNNEASVPYMSLNLANSTAYPTPLTLTFVANTDIVAVAEGTAGISVGWYVCGQGISDFTEVSTVSNSTHLVLDTNTWSSSSGDYYVTPGGVAWQFPANSSGDLFGPFIGDILNDINAYVGSITKIVAENPGEDYNLAPMVLVREPYVSGFNAKDYIITYTNSSGNFMVGEQISQDNGAVGLIKDIVITSSSVMYVRRQNLPIGANSSMTAQFTLNGVITGTATSANATIIGIAEDDSALGIGLNAVISANVTIANGVVGSLDLLSSGFNFFDNEGVTFLSSDGLRAGSAKAKLIKEGYTLGTYEDEASFLSDGKYLFDGNYYQEYSYDIKTSIPRESYLDNYNSTMHLAGTKMFSTFVHTTVNEVNIDLSIPESANLTANIA